MAFFETRGDLPLPQTLRIWNPVDYLTARAAQEEIAAKISLDTAKCRLQVLGRFTARKRIAAAA